MPVITEEPVKLLATVRPGVGHAEGSPILYLTLTDPDSNLVVCELQLSHAQLGTLILNSGVEDVPATLYPHSFEHVGEVRETREISVLVPNCTTKFDQRLQAAAAAACPEGWSISGTPTWNHHYLRRDGKDTYHRVRIHRYVAKDS